MHCPGCISRSLWNPQKGSNLSVLALTSWIISIQDQYEGVSITGGEPFEQYNSLISFCALVKTLTKLNIYIYSGYSLEELTKQHPDKLFMKYTDYLLDGRYVRRKHDDQNSRGSSNQILYKFIENKPVEQKEAFTSNKWSVTISPDGTIYMAGIPKKNDMQYLRDSLVKLGINLRAQ